MKQPVTAPSPETRARMKRTRRADTSPEVLLQRISYAQGLRYRKDHAPVAGLRTRADLAFIGVKVAVYVDGCFWHGCPTHATWPKNNGEFWRAKIEANMARDCRVNASLVEAGWFVIRVWEHESPVVAADRVEAGVRGRGRQR